MLSKLFKTRPENIVRLTREDFTKFELLTDAEMDAGENVSRVLYLENAAEPTAAATTFQNHDSEKIIRTVYNATAQDSDEDAAPAEQRVSIEASITNAPVPEEGQSLEEAEIQRHFVLSVGYHDGDTMTEYKCVHARQDPDNPDSFIAELGTVIGGKSVGGPNGFQMQRPDTVFGNGFIQNTLNQIRKEQEAVKAAADTVITNPDVTKFQDALPLAPRAS